MVKAKKKRGFFSSISLPIPLVKKVENVVEGLGYWPTKTAFIREAIMEKLRTHMKELEDRRDRESAVD